MKNNVLLVVALLMMYILPAPSYGQGGDERSMVLHPADADGRVAIAITMKDFPGEKFVLEIPEVFTLQEKRGGLSNYDKQNWNFNKRGADMIFQDNNQVYTIRLKIIKKKQSIGLAWDINFKNNTADTLHDLASFNCWTMNFAPLFKDLKMERTYVQNDKGIKILLKEVLKNQGEGKRTMQFYPSVTGVQDPGKSRWINQWNVNSPQTLAGHEIAVVSTDGKWIFKNIVFGEVAYFFNNWESDHGCVHASPLLAKQLLPGHSAHSRGIFNFVKLN